MVDLLFHVIQFSAYQAMASLPNVACMHVDNQLSSCQVPGGSSVYTQCLTIPPAAVQHKSLDLSHLLNLRLAACTQFCPSARTLCKFSLPLASPNPLLRLFVTLTSFPFAYSINVILDVTPWNYPELFACPPSDGIEPCTFRLSRRVIRPKQLCILFLP